MALYTITRVYKVPAENRYQATDRMIEAIFLHTEKDYHVNDYIREPEDKSWKGKKVELGPPTGWLTLLKRQLIGQ